MSKWEALRSPGREMKAFLGFFLSIDLRGLKSLESAECLKIVTEVQEKNMISMIAQRL